MPGTPISVGEGLQVCCPSQRGTNRGNSAAKSRGHPGSVRQKLGPGFVTYRGFLFQSSAGTKRQDCLEQLLLPHVVLA